MPRNESRVLQSAPMFENQLIQEMEKFGWSLQGRQEIHEVGDSKGADSFLGDKYVVKTKVSHYVKLHFTRDLDLPGLEGIRAVEREYFAVAYPSLPSWKWYLAAVFCIASGLGIMDQSVGGALFTVAVGVALGAWTLQRRASKVAARAAADSRRSQLLHELETSTSQSAGVSAS